MEHWAPAGLTRAVKARLCQIFFHGYVEVLVNTRGGLGRRTKATTGPEREHLDQEVALTIYPMVTEQSHMSGLCKDNRFQILCPCIPISILLLVRPSVSMLPIMLLPSYTKPY